MDEMSRQITTLSDLTHDEWNSIAHPFIDHLRFTARLDEFERLAKHGLEALSRQAEWADVILRTTGSPPEEFIRDDEPLKRQSEAAQREIDDEFDLLHHQLIVLLWSNLEETIRQVVVGIVQHLPSAIDSDRTKKIRVPLGVIVTMDDAERANYLVNLLEAELASNLSKGVGRFEKLFDSLGLGGPIPHDLAKAILELQQSRHVIVHRRGLVDQKFKDSCPWTDATIGRHLKITNGTFKRLKSATARYAGELGHRLSKKRGHKAMAVVFNEIRQDHQS